MAEFPALPMWTDAYLADTTHLSTLEHGAYFLLLMVAWRSRGTRLPDDDHLLAKYARMRSDNWKKMRPILEPFFEVKDGYWTQLRLLDEMTVLHERREKAADNGRLSARKRKGRHVPKSGPKTPDLFPEHDSGFDIVTAELRANVTPPIGLRANGHNSLENGNLDIAERIAERERNSNYNPTPTTTTTPIIDSDTKKVSVPISPILKPEHVVETWNGLATRRDLAKVAKLTPDRKRKLGARIRENRIEQFGAAFEAIERSDFLCGDNNRSWRVTFDWMLEPKNFTKLIEGTYDRAQR